jgi:DNA-directed RNA polymerase specialized sigma24 family protein
MKIARVTHLWSDLEPHFQVVARWVACRSRTESAAIQQAELVIADRAAQFAFGQFKKWGVRSACQEGEDASQEWSLFMYSRGYGLCDPARPVHRFAFQVLKFMCMAASRKAHRWLPLMENFDVADGCPSPLSLIIAREEESLLAMAMEELSPGQRGALQSIAGRRNYGAAFRARKRLNKRFENYRQMDA